MGLLCQLKTELEQEMPGRLRQSLQATLDVCQAQCPDCRLAMHRHHAYRRSIMTGYGMAGCGAVELWIPVFRCGERRRMSRGADVSGSEERYRRYSKTGETALKPAALRLGYAAASGWVRAVKSTLCRWRKRGRGAAMGAAGGGLDRRAGGILAPESLA